MLARLHILLPFTVTIPKDEQFNIYEYVDEGYKIRIYHPLHSTEPTEQQDFDDLLINDKPTIQANVLRIDFFKENFNRSKNIECDPSYALVNRTINAFLLKLRFVTRATHIRPLDFRFSSWNLTYLNDDGSELREEKELVLRRTGIKFTFQCTALTKEIWNDIHSLAPNYMPPEWISLLLDADAALPEIGSSIVLAATALEVFIAHILNKLAKRSSIPKEVWDWINNRNWWLKEPDSKEQFDTLLQILLGESLKKNNDLWEAFCNLREARNSFVHEGNAKIKRSPTPLTLDEAKKLIVKANDIIEFIKDKLPVDLQWPAFKYTIQVTAIKNLPISKGKKN